MIFSFRSVFYNIIKTSFYAEYVGSQYDVYGHGYGQLALYIILLAFCLIMNWKKKDTDRKEEILLSMALIGALIQIMATQIAIASRLIYDFSMAFTILPVNSIMKLKKQSDKSAIAFVIIIIVLIYLYYICPITGYTTILAN